MIRESQEGIGRLAAPQRREISRFCQSGGGADSLGAPPLRILPP